MSEKILIVEDHPDLRELLFKLLSPLYEVISSENGEQALKELSTNSFDLILTDFNMPTMDGLTLSKKVSENWPMIPLIMMTGRPGDVDLTGTNIVFLMTKPFDTDLLIQKINSILESGSL